MLPNKQTLPDDLFDETLSVFKAATLSSIRRSPQGDEGMARGCIHATLRESKRNESAGYLHHLPLAMMLTGSVMRACGSLKITEITRPEPLSDAEVARPMICRLARMGSGLPNYPAINRCLPHCAQKPCDRSIR